MKFWITFLQKIGYGFGFGTGMGISYNLLQVNKDR